MKSELFLLFIPHPSSLIPFLTVLFPAQVQDQQAVAVVAQERSSLDGAGEAERLLEAAVGDFELVVDDAFAEEGVAAAPPYDERPAPDLNLDIVGAHARQVDLDDPAVRGPVNVRVGPPRARPWPRPPPHRDHPKIPVHRFSHKNSDE